MTEVAVVVVNWNGGEWLDRCLRSVLAQQPPPAEILVVDNASTDASLSGLPAGVKVLNRPRNDGYAAALIDGLAAVRAPAVLTLNPDVELQAGCLAAAQAVLASDPQLGAVALRVLSLHDPQRLDAIGIGLTSRFGPIDFGHGRRDAEVGSAEQDVLGPLGGAALWRREAVAAVGGPCPQYFLYFEDLDLALRLARAGFRCRTAPAARALHAGGGTIGRGGARNVFFMVRNHAACLLATLPAGVLRRRAAWLLLAPLRAATLHARRGQLPAALAGLLAAPLLLPGAWRRRAALHRAVLALANGDRAAAARLSAEAEVRLRSLFVDADEERRRSRAARTAAA